MPLCCSLSDHPGGRQWRGEDISAGSVRPGQVHPRLLLGHCGHRIHSKRPASGPWCTSVRVPAGNRWTLTLDHSRRFHIKLHIRVEAGCWGNRRDGAVALGSYRASLPPPGLKGERREPLPDTGTKRAVWKGLAGGNRATHSSLTGREPGQ